jgi:hypothetical protein
MRPFFQTYSSLRVVFDFTQIVSRIGNPRRSTSRQKRLLDALQTKRLIKTRPSLPLPTVFLSLSMVIFEIVAAIVFLDRPRYGSDRGAHQKFLSHVPPSFILNSLSEVMVRRNCLGVPGEFGPASVWRQIRGVGGNTAADFTSIHPVQ